MIIEKTENGIYKMLDLSELPKRKWGEGEIIDWEKVNGHTASFVYKEEKGILDVAFVGREENNKYNKLIKVNYQNTEAVIRTASFLRFQWRNLLNPLPKSLYKYFVNKEGLEKVSASSNRRALLECPECKERKEISIFQLSSLGFSCFYCQGGESNPEKIVRIALEENNIDYIPQYEHPLLKNRRFDFYLPVLNTFIEVQGEQHYQPRFGKNAFMKTQERDDEKRIFCKKNEIRLCEIEARRSDLKYMINSLNETQLPFLKINKKQIEDKFYSNSEKKRNIKIIHEYHINKKTSSQISKEMGLNYNLVKTVIRESGVPRVNHLRKIVLINTRTIFQSGVSTLRVAGLKSTQSVFQNCSGLRSSAGKHPVTGEKLKWMYYEDYVEKYGTEGLTEYVEGETHI